MELAKMPDPKTGGNPKMDPKTSDVLPDADGLYRRYLESCQRLGVAPVSGERVRALVGEWNRLVDGESDATATH
jgi:hypothetical protein